WLKRAGLAGLPPLPVTAQAGDEVPVVSPERVTVNVNGVLPLLPSFLFASNAAIANDGNGAASSLLMLPFAVAVVMVALVGDDSVTVKPSLASNDASPAPLPATTSLPSPATKVTVPVGNTPPLKSAALAAL